MLLRRALKPAVSPGGVPVEGEHLLQVLEHVVEDPAPEAGVLKHPPLLVHGLSVGLEVAVEVSFLVRLVVGVEVVLVSLLAEGVKVFENVIEVEGLVVLFEVIVAASFSSWAVCRGRAVAELIVLSSSLVIRKRFIC